MGDKPKRIDSRRIDLKGQQFGELKVIQLSDKRNEHNTLLWECLCSCGNTTYVTGGSLRAGHYKSCGCKLVEKRDKGAREHIQTDRVDGTRITALKTKLHVGNKSGHKGVMWDKRKQRWKAYIGFQGKNYALGSFMTKEEAIAARQIAEEKYHKPILEREEQGD
ncbi:AP2 domain-containing protein [Cohnella xylanilytica]|uniref:AP2 domain-containing protein n=1 Tax=Cohnella xylanilytica TaxID=557555 RepID=UPI001B0BC1FD|nr:AP2 domain-containing protein [Cohnella xylanilytica]GIO13551.1 AP2 domain-containing protein [Cohnella xylanilytica]